MPEPLGSAGALRRIQAMGGFIDDTTAVLCGDAVINLDLQAVAARHRAQGAVATVVTREVAASEVSNFGIVVSDDDGRVRSFQEKPAPAQALSRMASTGIYLVEPAALQHIPADRPYDIGSELFPALVAAGAPFYAQGAEFDWLDIGRVADYWQIVQRVMAGGVAGLTLPGREVRPGVRVGLNASVAWDAVRIDGPVYIGSGARIEAGVDAGACVERSVLFDYAHIGARATAREMIVSGSYCVTRDGAAAPAAANGSHWWGDARALAAPAAAIRRVA